MAKQFRTKTVHDFDVTLELQKVVGNVLTPGRNLKKRGLLLVGGVAGLAAGAYFAFANKPLSAVILLSWGIIALLWSVFFYYARARKAMKMMKGTVLVEFVFEKDTILVFQGGRSSRYPYADILRLLETERFFYGILNSGQGLMMDKDNLQGGRPEEFKDMLETNTGRTAEFLRKF